MATQWASVKKVLQTESRSGLVKLIKDLYELRPENQAFLHARIQQSVVSAAPYRQRMEQAMLRAAVEESCEDSSGPAGHSRVSPCNKRPSCHCGSDGPLR